MLEKLAEYITNRWMHRDIICKEEYEIYQFGVKQMLEFLICSFAVIGLGILFSELIGCLIFSFAFVSLRIYAGGYHASTPVKCFAITIFATTASLSVIKYLDISVLCCAVMLILSAGIILRLSPVESKNRPLDDIEKVVYHRKCIRIWGVEIICAAAGLAVGYRLAAVCIMAAHVMMALALMIGEIQRSYTKKLRKGEK